MPLDAILCRLRDLLPELMQSENFVLARSVREVIALIEEERPSDAGTAPASLDAA